MNIFEKIIINILIFISLTIDINAEDLSFEGSWELSLQDGTRTLIGALEIEKQGSTWEGYLEGGPVEIIIDAMKLRSLLIAEMSEALFLIDD
tara:strand:+ start:302 stop:577 length:276 start_codon:yes stop_codon:yes gene_type:complete